VICFESAADDSNGVHAAIMLDTEHGVFPPNTLFRLKRIERLGEWEAPGGTFPRRRLLVVTATYRPPSAGLMRVGDTDGKLCAAAVTLSYGAVESQKPKHTHIACCLSVLLVLGDDWCGGLSFLIMQATGRRLCTGWRTLSRSRC
jgi:hypothetical protein